MALDDPRFRPAVRRTFKATVFALWAPLVLVLFGVVFFASTSILVHRNRDFERVSRTQRLLFVAANIELCAETRHHGDLSAALDDFARGVDDQESSFAARETAASENGVTLEFADTASLASGFDPSMTWIVRERVPASQSPAMAVFADGHVAPLER